MTWASLILALIKLALSLTTWAREKELLQAGQDKAIATASLEVLEATTAGKELRDRITAMDDPEVDDLWRRMTEQ